MLECLFCAAHVVQESLIRLANEDEESDEMANSAQEHLETLKENMDQNGGILLLDFTLRGQPVA